MAAQSRHDDTWDAVPVATGYREFPGRTDVRGTEAASESGYGLDAHRTRCTTPAYALRHDEDGDLQGLTPTDNLGPDAALIARLRAVVTTGNPFLDETIRLAGDRLEALTVPSLTN